LTQLVLMIGAVAPNLMRIGVLVLYVHDASDVFVDLLKLANYTKLSGMRGFFVTEIAYISSIVGWAYWRLWMWPTKVVYSMIFEWHAAHAGGPDAGYPWRNLFPENMPNYVMYVFGFSALVVMHSWWFYILARVGIRLALNHDARDVSAEEYEGRGSEDDE
jgi:hypothetical protein